MTCDEVDGRIEAIAAGDPPTGDIAEHLASCARCRGAVALARRIHEALARPDAAAPPSGFAAAVQRRVRRDWWRREQAIDLTFNLAVAAGLTIVAAGVWLLLQASGLVVVTADLSGLVVAGFQTLVEGLRPRLQVYTLSAVVLCMTVVVWWWVERGSAH